MFTGREVKCPKCGKVIEVPDRFHDFSCPDCGENITDTKKESSGTEHRAQQKRLGGDPRLSLL